MNRKRISYVLQTVGLGLVAGSLAAWSLIVAGLVSGAVLVAVGVVLELPRKAGS